MRAPSGDAGDGDTDDNDRTGDTDENDRDGDPRPPRTVLVAGVGESLGTGLARAFADAGDRVALLARSPEYVESLAADLRDAGGEAVAVTADVTDDGALEEAVGAVTDAFGPVDVAIHNANDRGGGLDDAESFRRPLRTRAEGGAALARATLPGMRERGDGTLLFAGTTHAFDGSERLPGWGAAAFATRGLSRSLARRAGPDGVHVCYVAVGGTIPPADAEFRPAGAMDARTVGERFVALADQPPAAWSHEVDLRPSGQPP
ncbi:SDR family NAD(P)-dependent oxidoreductase [Halobaculum gomorrense]|uniref:NADP-dependent 3-hydroxy acid dehydrogenase YdfG n=1 Tax=Halobaculum gomorrense TaxID=43928 RepID=A0A1M5QG73_9EURY|nr:SDR family NAD(P)-dependent oxidoreductase [Halobaculum gomorrense]SHH12866.1 NADP-dependent 3-hydroxy acid dehydrogenase YdfG [Halobaculum gomorrense]